jgi:hypothetical protein
MNAKYKISDGFALPEPDGSARFGPRPHKLDIAAVNGIKSGLYADALDAAKALAPKYHPVDWRDKSKEERRYYIRSKRKKYNSMLNRLDPSRAS